MSKKPVITICSSANFYRQVVEIQAQLQKHGFKVIIPHTAQKMKRSGDYDVSHYRTWFKDSKDYHKKTWLMREHFKEVVNSDIILVINNQKHGIDNYIGGNVLMEMALAFHPIFLSRSKFRRSRISLTLFSMQLGRSISLVKPAVASKPLKQPSKVRLSKGTTC